MSTIVIYDSKYGHTEQFAKWISEELSVPMMPLSEAEAADLASYQTIVFGAPIYAGMIKGKNFFKKTVIRNSIYLP